MKKPAPQNSAFNVSSWMAGHRDFVAWWKNHRHSGFHEDEAGRSHYGIPPWQAWGVERYRAEYSGKSRSYSAAEIAEMRAEACMHEEVAPEFIATTKEEAKTILSLCVAYLGGARSIFVDGEPARAKSAEDYVFHKIRELKDRRP